MGFMQYVFKTPIRNVWTDIGQFRALCAEIASVRRVSRAAYDNMIVDRGECRYGMPYANPFAGCVQQFWKWEYDIQMRMDIARQYDLNCPKFSKDGWRCSYENCRYLPHNNTFFDARRKLKQLKQSRAEFWARKFARVK